MILGALLDAGIDYKEWRKFLPKEIKIEISRVKRREISALLVEVKNPKRLSFQELKRVIEATNLDKEERALCLKILDRLKRAEAKVHKESRPHLHELGSEDLLVDIIGSIAGLKLLKVEEVYASPLNVGSGIVMTHHGELPVPAPATLELLKGVPIYQKGEKELVTPTGAVIITTLAKNFGDLPPIYPQLIGYGAGTLTESDFLRVIIGDKKKGVIVIETNIDDMNPQFFDTLFDRLFKRGALDVFLTPVYMKKNRPGILLTVLSLPENKDSLIATIFENTTSLGIRIRETERYELEREIMKVKTRYGIVRIKIGKLSGEIKNIAPEYEDCKRIALTHNLPVKLVYEEAIRVFKSH